MFCFIPMIGNTHVLESPEANTSYYNDPWHAGTDANKTWITQSQGFIRDQLIYRETVV